MPYQFPYTNLHDLDLDWMLNQVKDAKDKVDSFTSDENYNNIVNDAVERVENSDQYQQTMSDVVAAGTAATQAANASTEAAGRANSAAQTAEDVSDIVAEPFLTTKNYSEGWYVTYSGNLYKFITFHSAGAWNNTEVEAVTVGTQLTNIDTSRVSYAEAQTLTTTEKNIARTNINAPDNDITVSKKSITPATYENTLAKLDKSCVLGVTSSYWNDLPTEIPSGTLINCVYDTNFANQILIAYPSRQLFSRFVNFSTGNVLQNWKEYFSALPTGTPHFKNTSPASYSNKLYNITEPISFGFGANDGWEDAPAATAGLIDSFQYGNNLIIQTFYSYPTMQSFIRVINTSTHAIVVDWTRAGAGDYETVWYALGDSITAGSYSNEQGQGVTVTDAAWSYPRRIERNRRCVVYNLAVPGMALTEMGTKARQVREVATLVTITGGANDYYGKTKQLGTHESPADYTTVCGAIKSMIETVAGIAPNARIVLISPLIIKYGSASTKWSMNYAVSDKGNFTYEQLSNAMKEIAEDYNIEFIDGTHTGPVNVLNIGNVEKDNVHPTRDFYNTYANWIESKLF